MDKLLNTKEVADLLGVCHRTVLNYIHREALPAVRFKKEWRIRESTLKKWIEKKERVL